METLQMMPAETLKKLRWTLDELDRKIVEVFDEFVDRKEHSDSRDLVRQAHSILDRIQTFEEELAEKMPSRLEMLAARNLQAEMPRPDAPEKPKPWNSLSWENGFMCCYDWLLYRLGLLEAK
jgi:hypothetical protein